MIEMDFSIPIENKKVVLKENLDTKIKSISKNIK